jgi:hypothetical protein
LKNTGQCPKCDSQYILRAPGWTGAYGSGNYVLAGTRLILPVKAKVARYVCTQCGYCEEWVDDDKELEKVKQHYQKSSSSV